MRSYVINLDRSPERLAFMEGQFRALGLDFQRVAAIDCQDFSGVESESSPLQPAELACLMSHRKAWQAALEHRGAYAAFFEDDAVLSDAASAFLQAEDWIPADVHTLRLETISYRYVYIERRGRPVIDRHLHRMLSNHHGAAGYVLRLDHIPIWLAATEQLHLPVDEVLFAGPGLRHNLTAVYQLVPGAVRQRSLDPREGVGAFQSLLGHEVEFGRATHPPRRRSERSLAQKLVREFGVAWIKCRQKVYGPVRTRIPFG